MPQGVSLNLKRRFRRESLYYLALKSISRQILTSLEKEEMDSIAHLLQVRDQAMHRITEIEGEISTLLGMPYPSAIDLSAPAAVRTHRERIGAVLKRQSELDRLITKRMTDLKNETGKTLKNLRSMGALRTRVYPKLLKRGNLLDRST